MQTKNNDMNERTTATLAQIVINDYRATAVFEQYQLDFCCRGKRTLQEACAEKAIPAEEVLAALRKAMISVDTTAAGYDNTGMGRLADYIVAKHHNYVNTQMPLIYGYLQKVAGKHGDRYPYMVQVLSLFTLIKDELEQHMQKEEIVLFPRIRAIEQAMKAENELVVNSTYLQAPINMMEQEHEQAGSLMAEIRKLTNDYTPADDACTTHRMVIAALRDFEQNLHQHVHLENNVLFPGALNLFRQTGQHTSA